MNSRTITILAVLAILLGTIYYFDYREKVRRETAEVSQSEVVPFTTNQIDHMTIKNSSGVYVLEKKDNKWWMSSPSKGRADQKMITGQILPVLAEAKKSNPFSIGAPKDGKTQANPIATYGLGEGAIRVTVGSDAAKKTAEFILGAETSIQGEMYIQDAADPAKVYVTSLDLKKAFERNLVDLLEKTVISIATENLTKISIHPPDDDSRTLIAQRDTAGAWTIEQQSEAAPIAAYPADARIFDAILRSLEGMKTVDSIAKDNLPKYGLDKKAGTLELIYWKKGDNNTSVPATTVFDFGYPIDDNDTATSNPLAGIVPDEKLKKPVKYYTMRTGGEMIYEADAKLLNMMKAPLELYRDRRLFTFQPDEISYLQVELINSAIAFSREAGGEWHFAADPTVAISQEKVRLYSKFCLELGIDQFAPEPPAASPEEAGLISPLYRVTMSNADRSIRQGFEIGKQIGSTPYYYARRTYATEPRFQAEIFAVALPTQLRTVLFRTDKDFTAKPLMSFSLDSVGKVEFAASKDAKSSASLIVALDEPKGGQPAWRGSINNANFKALPEKDCRFLVSVLKGLEYIAPIPKEKMTPEVLEKTGLKNPATNIRVYDKKNGLLSSISFNDLSKSDMGIVIDGRGDFYYVRTSSFDGLGSAMSAIGSRLK